MRSNCRLNNKIGTYMNYVYRTNKNICYVDNFFFMSIDPVTYKFIYIY